MRTRVTELLGIRYPIVQGGLAYLAYAEMAAAVSNAGALGQITAMSLPSPEALREEIQKVRQLTSYPFGVNFAIGQHGRPFADMVQVALEEKVPVVSVTGGNPEPLFQMLEGHDVKKLVLIASVRQAQKAESIGADAVMAVGQEGGGHLGRDDIGTIVLVPRVVDSVSIPVLASGGIGDGRGLVAGLALGAEGIEMGTRFIATKECIAHPRYKERIVQSKETDTVVIKRSLGAPGRALNTEGAQRILDKEAAGATYEMLKEEISGTANRKAIHKGEIEKGFAWAGQVVGLIDNVPTVEGLIREMVDQAKQSFQRLDEALR